MATTSWAVVLRGLVTLPMVLPPVVGGIALLLAYGRRGIIGEPLYDATGLTIPFTLPGVIVAESFVAMPFFVITAETGLRSMDRRLEDAARTLGAGRWTVFTRLPLICALRLVLVGVSLVVMIFRHERAGEP
jgi:molybdate transport system permease protein